MVRDILYPGLGQAPVGSAVGHLVNREGLLIGSRLLVVFLQNPKAPITFVDPGNLKRVCEKNFWDPGKGPDLDELDSLADAEVGDPCVFLSMHQMVWTGLQGILLLIMPSRWLVTTVGR